MEVSFFITKLSKGDADLPEALDDRREKLKSYTKPKSNPIRVLFTSRGFQ